MDVGIMYDVMSFRLTGTSDEMVDRAAGRYTVRFAGEGTGISNLVESEGVWRNGRWVPTRAVSRFEVAGRQSRSEITYDHDRGVIGYHYRGETFFLRRPRVADDAVKIPPGARIDDVISATLNYEEALWPAEPDGTFQTWVVRRQRREDEGPDDVQSEYRAELVPFVLRVQVDADTHRPVAAIDLTRFSSWAKPGRPARVVFGARRRPESIACSLILGTSVKIRLAAAP